VEEIAESMRLYTALLRCIERKANATSAEGSKREEIDEVEPEATFETLLSELQLPKLVKSYWKV
jgi:hypothetical protein